MRLTRLAPSPTGALHLGNARTFLINYILAKQNNWDILLRIDDLDGPRIKRGADQNAIADLTWLGLQWTAGPIYQAARREIYNLYLRKLIEAGRVYPCICSRREVELAASAPHAEDGATVYPGTCRGRFSSIDQAQTLSGKPPALRFQVTGDPIEFDDKFAGKCRFDPVKTLGDFVIAKADGTPAYHLATVVDDALAGVTDVVRGDDLIDSTPRQMMIYRALGWEDKIPNYTHLPLVVGEEGRRLAKRHGDTRLEHYRSLGVTSERVLQLLMKWCGVHPQYESGDAMKHLLHHFRLSNLPRGQVVYTESDHAFLKGQ